MPKNLFQKKFNPNINYVARRAFTGYDTGDVIVKSDFTEHRLKQMYSSRMIVREDVWDQFVGAPSPVADAGLPAVKPAPLDSGESDPLQPLRDELEAAGVKVDKRWGEARLNEELEKATAPAALPGVNDGAA